MNRGEDIGIRDAVALILHSLGMEPIFVLTPQLYDFCG